MTAGSARSRGTERALILASALSSLGTGLTIPFVLVYLSEVIGLGLTRTTAILAVPGLVSLALIALTGPVIDEIGSRRYGLGATLISVLGSLMLSASTKGTAALAVAGAILVPLGIGAFAPAFQAQVGLALQPDRHARFFSLQAGMANAMLGMGGLLASALVGLQGLQEIRWLFVADAVSFALLGMLTARHFMTNAPSYTAPAADDAHGPRAQVRHRASTYLASLATPFRDRRFRTALTLTFSLTLVGLAQFEFAFPAYAATNAAALIGIGFAVNAVVGAVFQLAVARYLVEARLARVVTGAALTWALSWAAIALLDVSSTWVRVSAVIVFAVLFGVAEALVIAAVPAVVLSAADPARLGTYMSFNSIVFQSGRMAAPILLTLIAFAGRQWIPAAFLALSLALVPVIRRGFGVLARHTPNSQEVPSS